ncbi:tetratricopeptide repeat protein [Hahella ganghwensis]|uniref:tetratricopeptide repeat protein n=1 Tax=Hahella ganghwensis TaxID=286420 RepID=UPI00036B3F8A|nr:tetratricopeptide repeat protein [Hahella ganghwensis]
MSSLKRLMIHTILMGSLAGCSMIGSKDDEDHARNMPTLAELQPVTLEEVQEEEVKVDISEVISHYQDLLPSVADPEVRARILYRLADLKMLQTDEVQDTEVAEVVPGYDEYELTVQTYESLLETYPDRADNDQVLYQLSKAYDLQGKQDATLDRLDQLVGQYPESDHAIEANFRRGEILYSQGDYPEAGKAFDLVVSRARSNNTFFEKALYMKGWSQFKQGSFNEALKTFVALLDQMLPERASYEPLDEDRTKLLNDQFRVMGFAFSYMDGAESVQQLFQEVGERHYEHLVYDNYANLLISREQEIDAIKLYQQYISLHPYSLWSPQYQAKVIDIQMKEGLVSEAREEKARFVDNYGIRSDFRRRVAERRGKPIPAVVDEKLSLFIDELAKYHHARAQQQRKSGGNAKPEYRLASRYYGEFAETFPNSPNTPQMVYLLGETLYEVGDYDQAIVAYERAAYEYPAFAEGAEAGYAAITTHSELISQSPEASRDILTSQKVASQLRFVDHYPQDPRALDVQANAAATLFESKDYLAAIPAATKVTEWQPLPSQEVQLNAWLIISHSEYALNHYALAERAYAQSIALMVPGDQRRVDTVELLAASIYRQGEMLLTQGETEAAIDEFLRVGLVTPDAKIRVNAQYDAATYMLKLSQYDRAIPVLEDFRARYPAHELSQDIPAKLAVAYRETKQWDYAARELKAIAGSHEDPEVRRESLLMAAEIYEANGYVAEAIETYRNYAHTYPEPADLAMEAQFVLAGLYKTTNEPEKRNFWLRKLEESYASHSDEASDRMRFLAAGATIELADDAYAEFQQIKLRAPLSQNLARKKKTMAAAMNAYKKAANYRIAEYTTRSTFQMGEIYAQFSRDLLDSERPANLSDLELEQYELLLEDQAYPFEEDAISIHESNAQRSWDGVYDTWVKNSFKALEKLFPVRYQRTEEIPVVSESIL